MANTQGEIQFSPESLKQNFVKWRKDLLTIPTLNFRTQLGDLFEIRTGVRYQEKIGQLSGDAQLGPYDPHYTDTNDAEITARTLEVHLGSCVKQMDPNTAIQTIWDEQVAAGEKGKNIPFVKFLAGFYMRRISENLYNHVWDGVRNASGHRTVDLFDGIETIINKEITAGNISAANGNFKTIQTITTSNAEDVFKDFYRSANKKLRGMFPKLYLVCSEDDYNKYVDCYQANHGSLPYNNEFDKKILEGSRGKCEIKVVDGVSDNFLKLVPPRNFTFGTNVNGEETSMEIAESKTSHFLYDVIAKMFAGFQVARIEKEFLFVGKPAATPSKVATPTFSPAEYGEGATVDVTLACSTAGATIHYTTDGSTPTAESSTYSSAITLSATTTIKAIAVKDGMTTSDIASKTYTKAG